MAIMKNGNKIKNTQLSKKNKSDSSDLPEIATKQTNNTTKETQLSKEEFIFTSGCYQIGWCYHEEL